MSHYKELLIST